MSNYNEKRQAELLRVAETIIQAGQWHQDMSKMWRCKAEGWLEDYEAMLKPVAHTSTPKPLTPQERITLHLLDTVCVALGCERPNPTLGPELALENAQILVPHLAAHLAQHPEAPSIAGLLLRHAKTVFPSPPASDPEQLELPLQPPTEPATPATGELSQEARLRSDFPLSVEEDDLMRRAVEVDRNRDWLEPD